MEASETAAIGCPYRLVWLRVLIVLAGAALLTSYGATALIAQDHLWFVKRFDRSPVNIVIHHHEGQRTELWPGHPDFDQLSIAICASLSKGLEQPSGLSFSDASLAGAYPGGVMVEAIFLRPVRLHTWFETAESTHMLFPITERHSSPSLVVLGRNGQYISSPSVLRTVEPLRQTLHTLGYY